MCVSHICGLCMSALCHICIATVHMQRAILSLQIAYTRSPFFSLIGQAERARRVELLRAELRHRELSQCSFRPSISDRAKHARHTSIGSLTVRRGEGRGERGEGSDSALVPISG